MNDEQLWTDLEGTGPMSLGDLLRTQIKRNQRRAKKGQKPPEPKWCGECGMPLSQNGLCPYCDKE